MGKFDGILFCTDLDGTLLRNDSSISKENIDAIEYFKSEGGMFTFITGRMPFYVSQIYDAVKPNVPIGCVNGGGLFDWNIQEYVWKSPLADGVVELIKTIDDNVCDAGIQVNTFYKTYFCKENSVMQYFRDVTGLPNLVGDYNKIDDPLAKIIFGCETDEEIFRVQKLLYAHPLSDNFAFIRSEKHLYEILPKDIGKDTALVELVEHLKLDISKTIAIGDYDNDIKILKKAKLGIAVANANEATRAVADIITVSNEEHAIAKVIEDLDCKKYVL